MKPSDFTHPEDAAALRQMESIPGFTTLVKKILTIGIENLQYGVNMASSIRLSEKQLPKIYRHLPLICKRWGIFEPEFYLQMSSIPNAWTSASILSFASSFFGTYNFCIILDDFMDFVNNNRSCIKLKDEVLGFLVTCKFPIIITTVCFDIIEQQLRGKIEDYMSVWYLLLSHMKTMQGYWINKKKTKDGFKNFLKKKSFSAEEQVQEFPWDA